MIFLYLVIFLIPISVYGNEKSFLFSEDNDLKDDGDVINLLKQQTNNNIKNSDFFNSPLTKLDYVLIDIEKKLEKIFDNKLLDQIVRDEFESIERYPPFIFSDVTYIEEIDKIIINAELSSLPKPKRSLKQICEERVLWMLDPSFPIWNDNLYASYLGILKKENKKNYDEEALALKGNIIHFARVHSYYDKVHYSIWCYKDSDGVTRYKKNIHE